MTLPRNNYIILIAQIACLITYLTLIFSGRYALALCSLAPFGIISIIQLIRFKRESHRLNQELRQVINKIERHYRYAGLSLGKPLNMEKELQGLREDIERHKRANDDSQLE